MNTDKLFFDRAGTWVEGTRRTSADLYRCFSPKAKLKEKLIFFTMNERLKPLNLPKTETRSSILNSGKTPLERMTDLSLLRYDIAKAFKIHADLSLLSYDIAKIFKIHADLFNNITESTL